MSKYRNRLTATMDSANGHVIQKPAAAKDAPPRPRRKRRASPMTLDQFKARVEQKRQPERVAQILERFIAQLPADAQETHEARAFAEQVIERLTGKRKQQAHDVLFGDAHRWARFWCSIYVAAALVLSGFLNGFANATFVENKPLGWCMGIIIPVFVFVLFKAAGWMQKQGNYPLAIAAAGFGSVLLFLSVADCQQSLSMLTHTPANWLSWAFAITIDCGLVVCELGSMGVLLRNADQ